MIRNALQRFMIGRYGKDELNGFLLVLYLLLYLLRLLTNWRPLGLVALVCVAGFLFRVLSRDFPRRQAENLRFLKLTGPIQNWLRLRLTMFRDRDHCYFKCPSCAQYLRVPRGKGKITVTCRRCGAVFQEKS